MYIGTAEEKSLLSGIPYPLQTKQNKDSDSFLLFFFLYFSSHDEIVKLTFVLQAFFFNHSFLYCFTRLLIAHVVVFFQRKSLLESSSYQFRIIHEHLLHFLQMLKVTTDRGMKNLRAILPGSLEYLLVRLYFLEMLKV